MSPLAEKLASAARSAERLSDPVAGRRVSVLILPHAVMVAGTHITARCAITRDFEVSWLELEQAVVNPLLFALGRVSTDLDRAAAAEGHRS